MHLWHGLIEDFVRDSQTDAITASMLSRYYTYYGCQPGEAEVRSWTNSLAALADVSRPLRSKDVGVVVEYHLPFSGKRIDAVFLGISSGRRGEAVIVELKQWSQVDVRDEFELNVLTGDGAEHAHPSQQALDYAGTLHDIHSAFVDEHLTAQPCSFCHNLHSEAADGLRSPQFDGLLKASPLFIKGDETDFAQHLAEHVGKGDGAGLMEEYTTGRFKPSKKVLDALETTTKQNDQWHLLGRQREAYNAVFAAVRRLQKRRERSAVLVRGGPGTGKTVIAIQLLADCLRLGVTAAHSTGGKAFTTTLRSKFKNAEKLFIWNLNTRKAPPQSMDLLLVDEAHRIRKTSETRFMPKSEHTGKAQIEEMLDCSKVTVFLLDENQYMRPDEIGCTSLVLQTCQSLGVPCKEFDLDTQFRCGGCTEYASWIDYLLGFNPVKPKPWGKQYQIRIAESVEDLDTMMADAKANEERARIVAGFCWIWSDPNEDGSLKSDVVVGRWARPWNAKHEDKKRYTPANDPYTLWAETPAGEQQVGCIYSAQGFEFDRVGVIWGNDLLWRNGTWIAQKEASFDRPVKAKNSDTLRLVRNAYRVLLTRGIKETWLYCIDSATRAHILEELQEMQA